jgi:hypothetical protein
MTPDNNYRPIFALSIIGFVFISLLNSFEGILSSLLKIIGMIAHFPPRLFYCLDFIPAIIILIIWFIIIFVSLKGYSFTDTILENIQRKLVLRFFILAIILFAISFISNLIYVLLQPKYPIDYGLDKFIMIASPILKSLMFLRIILIGIGFYKICIQKSTSANKEYKP